MASGIAVSLIVVTVVIGAESPLVDHPGLFVTLRAVACVGLLLVALVMRARGSGAPMAGLLIAASCVLALTGLTAADSPGWFAIGRIAVPFAILFVVYIALAYPSGRIEDRVASVAFSAGAAATLGLLAANMLLSRVPPVAGPFVRCSGTRCPPNPFNLFDVGSQASMALSTTLAVVTGLALVGVGVLVARRWTNATGLQRRSLTPLLAWTALAALWYALYVVVRAFDAHAPLLTPVAVIVVASIATLPLAIALGLAGGSVFAFSALEQMITELGEQTSLLGLQQTVSRAFADPTLKLLFWGPSARRFVDAEGRDFDVAAPELQGKVTRFSGDGDTVAGVVHDPVLSDNVHRSRRLRGSSRDR